MDDISELFTVTDDMLAEYRDLSARLPDAEGAVRAAVWEHENAMARFNAVVCRVNDAIYHGEDPCSAALRWIIDSERQRRDVAGANMTRARNNLADLKWRLECMDADIQQLRRAANPPKAGSPLAVERVRRPAPEAPDPVIVFPSGRAA